MTELAPTTQPAPPVAVVETVIGPPTGWQLINFAELWSFRDLLYFLAWRDVKVRYKQTALGAAWAVLQPLLMMAIFTILFGRLAAVESGGVPYPIFAFAGLVPWTFFATAIASAGNSVVGSERLITKIYFPRLAVPFAAVGAAVVDFAVACALLIAMVLGSFFWAENGGGVQLTAQLLLLPPLVAMLFLAATGVGTLLAALNVAYRDFRYAIPFLVQFWMFATPVVYPVSLVPEQWRWLMFLNPMAGLIDGYRAAFLGKPFDWAAISISLVVAAAVFAAAVAYFERVERRFADII